MPCNVALSAVEAASRGQVGIEYNLSETLLLHEDKSQALIDPSTEEEYSTPVSIVSHCTPVGREQISDDGRQCRRRCSSRLYSLHPPQI